MSLIFLREGGCREEKGKGDYNVLYKAAGRQEISGDEEAEEDRK
jgi:hypothetical protein